MHAPLHAPQHARVPSARTALCQSPHLVHEQVAACREGRRAPKLGNSNHSNWSDAEDTQLHAAVDSTPRDGQGRYRWATIAQQVPGRNGVQCQERWNQVIDPNIDHSEWRDEEVDRLHALVEQMGTRWEAVAKALSQGRSLRRSGNACKNTFNNSQRPACTAVKRPAGAAAAAPGAKRRSKPKDAPKPSAAAAKKKRAAEESEESESEESESEEEDDEDDEDEDGEDYVVEEVLDSKLDGRKVLYLVKWEGFDGEDDNTWEPQKHLSDCAEKLAAYWEAHPESAGAKKHAEELAAAAGGRALTKRAGKEAATLATAPDAGKKKARLGEAGPSSSSAGAARPSRAAASAANDKMDTLIKAGSSGIAVD